MVLILNKIAMKKIEKIDQELHEKFQECGKNAREWMRKCVMMLPEIEMRRVWEKKGFSCIYEYAAKLAGMSRGTVDDALWMLKKLEDLPELMEVAERKGLNAVRPVVAMANAETESFWATKAKVMSRQTLATYVKDMKNQVQNGLEMSENDGVFRTDPKLEMREISMKLKPEILAKLEKLKGKMDWNELMEQLLRERVENLEAKKPVAVKAKMVGSADGGEGRRYSRYVPAAVKRHVLAKTNGQCAFPGCVRRAKILHHTDRFAVKRWHDAEKIRPVCVAHERLAHLSLIANEERESEKWRVRREVDRNSLAFVVDAEVAEYRRR